MKLSLAKGSRHRGRRQCPEIHFIIPFFSLFFCLISNLGLESLWVLTFSICSSSKNFPEDGIAALRLSSQGNSTCPPWEAMYIRNPGSLHDLGWSQPWPHQTRWAPGWAMLRPSIGRVQRPGQRKCPIPPGTKKRWGSSDEKEHWKAKTRKTLKQTWATKIWPNQQSQVFVMNPTL